jgi:hypothetical protein
MYSCTEHSFAQALTMTVTDQTEQMRKKGNLSSLHNVTKPNLEYLNNFPSDPVYFCTALD